MNEKYDYKNFVYLRIPISEYNEIIEGKKSLKKSDLQRWVKDYDYRQAERRAYARLANQKRTGRIVKKLYNVLEDYYTGLFKEEQKELSINRLAKLAGVNYRTASKFWKENNLDEWLPKFKENEDELRNFYLQLTSKYSFFD